MKRVIVLILGVFSLLLSGSINPSLEQKLKNMADNEKIKVVIYLGSYDYNYIYTLSTAKQRQEYIRSVAYETQKPIVDYLRQKGWTEGLVQLQVANKIGVTLTKSAIYDIIHKFPQIVEIREDEYRKVIPDNEERHILSNFYPGEDYISGSVMNVKADEAWRRGYTGKGIVIGHLDTGFDPNHPVLKNRWRGISGWYDAINGQATPYDDNSHGTGTAGFAVGEHGIGVAPGALLISAKGLDANGSATEIQLSNAMNWFFNLADSLRPDLVTNSWGWANNDTRFWDEIQSWLSVGIIPVFAVGNSGPNANTTSCPGEYPMVFGIGATYWNLEQITSYSSRGPEPNQAPWNNTAWWPRSDWNRHKPDMIAPAEPTVTSAPDGQYQSFNGTSAATPHAAGVLALLLQANTFEHINSPSYDTARIRRIYRYMTDYAWWNPEWGTPSAVRDTFGWGRVDAEKYLSNLPEPSVPHVFIDSVWVVSTNDGDKDIEPAERNVYIGIRLKNTGANATGVQATITYTSNSNLGIRTGGPFSYGNLLRGDTASVTSFVLNAGADLPEVTRIYFTLKITATGYTKHDFFYLDTYKAEEPSQTISLINDNGSATYYPGNDNYYDSYTYFASRFEVPASGTMIACSIYCYNPGASAVTETLFVWEHNSTSDAPGNLIAYRVVSVSSGNGWKYFDIADISNIPAGYIWVGVNKADANENGVPYQDGDGASTTNKSTNTRNDPSSWTLETWWYDFMIRPRITTNAITAPSIFYEGSYILDDSKFGNGDGGIDPGEMAGLGISLKNLGLDAHNLVCTLKTADAYTANRIQILDNVAYFGDVPYGNPSANNYNDMWIIRCWDEDSMHGDKDFSFNVVVVGEYNNSSGGPFTYITTINFTISSPFIPYENTYWWIPSGVTGALYLLSQDYYPYYWFTDYYLGLSPLDSFYLDTIAYYGYYTTSLVPTIDEYLYDANPNAYEPNNQLWSQTNISVPSERGWIFTRPGMNVPGHVWFGIYNGGNPQRHAKPVFWGGALVGYLTLVDETLGSPWGDYGWVSLPLGFYFKLRHNHPALSYYRPTGWSWPLTPTNTNGGTTVPSTLSGYDWSTGNDTTWVALAILNRSGIDIPAVDPPTPVARDTWDNYIFLDNWSRWDVIYYNALPAWNYASATNDLSLLVPGGRHTLFLGIDWNTEVRGNIFNEYLRYWGMQFAWTAPDLYGRDAPKRVKWVPDLTGPGTGPYYNCTAYACSLYTSSAIPGYGKPWHAVAIRNFNISNAGDTIDLDLRLYSNKPEDAYTGYTDILEASELGPGEVDFTMVDGHHLGTKYYAGVYSFITPSNSPPDSTWIQWEMAREVITTGATWNYLDGSFTDSTIIHVYDVIIANGQTFSCSLRTLSGSQSFGIALYGSSNEDRIKRRIDYLALGTVTLPGPLYLSYTNSGPTDTFGLIAWGNLNAIGDYRLKFTGTSQPLGVMEIEFSAKPVDEGILLRWGDVKNAEVIYLEKSNSRGYEKIAEFSHDKNQYLDENVDNGKTYSYRLVIDYGKEQKILGPVSVIYFTPLPKVLTVLRINPVITRDKSVLKIAVPRKEKIDISIYDVTGRISEKIFSGYLERGIYEFNISKKTKGVYFIIVKDKERRIRKKVLFM